MEPATEALIREAADGSQAGRLHFGQVVSMLVQAGVESYAVDYRARRMSYFLPDGQMVEFTLPTHHHDAIADRFDAPALTSAIRLAQRGEFAYPEFKKLSRGAGCIGYVAWIAGRQVTYFGRRGEIHVEHFPD